MLVSFIIDRVKWYSSDIVSSLLLKSQSTEIKPNLYNSNSSVRADIKYSERSMQLETFGLRLKISVNGNSLVIASHRSHALLS